MTTATTFKARPEIRKAFLNGNRGTVLEVHDGDELIGVIRRFAATRTESFPWQAFGRCELGGFSRLVASQYGDHRDLVPQLARDAAGRC